MKEKTGWPWSDLEALEELGDQLSDTTAVLKKIDSLIEDTEKLEYRGKWEISRSAGERESLTRSLTVTWQTALTALIAERAIGEKELKEITDEIAKLMNPIINLKKENRKK